MSDLVLEQPPERPKPEPRPIPLAPAAGQKVTVKANRLRYDGRTGSIYRIWLLNIFLSVITLGIYSFWGKTRMRRYLTGSFSMAHDHFEYTGNGKELFIGFLKVAPVFIVVSFVASLLPRELAALLYLPVLYVIPVAVFMAMRYRLNRLTWRGIRARLTGSPFRFGGFALWRMFLNVVTLGILIPASDIATYGYMANRAGIGNLRARFEGKSAALVGTHIVTLILCVVAVVVLSFAAILVEKMMGLPSGVISILAFLVGAALIMLIRSFYHAALMREKMRGLTLGDIRFKCTATGYDVVKLRLVNLLILILTLGFGYPWAVQRRMDFVAQHLIIGGDLDNAALMQAAREKGGAGEGLDDLLGIDADFGIG